MMDVNVLFVYPQDWFGRLIDVVEGAGDDPSHCGIFMLDGLLEAIEGGFLKSPADTYRDCRSRMVVIDVPNIGDAQLEAKRLLNTPYGYIDCVNAGIYDVTGKMIPGDGELTVSCSEAVTRILRAGGLDVLPGVYADCVTPADLLRALEG